MPYNYILIVFLLTCRSASQTTNGGRHAHWVVYIMPMSRITSVKLLCTMTQTSFGDLRSSVVLTLCKFLGHNFVPCLRTLNPKNLKTFSIKTYDMFFFQSMSSPDPRVPVVQVFLHTCCCSCRHFMIVNVNVG